MKNDAVVELIKTQFRLPNDVEVNVEYEGYIGGEHEFKVSWWSTHKLEKATVRGIIRRSVVGEYDND